jgi:WD40 repeat protein
VYQCDNLGRLNWSTKIDCKNRSGKFSLGRKVSGITFVSQTEVIITTNDSRLRLFNLEECLQKVKFKGFKGESLQISPSLNKAGNRITMGSEDGNIFLWDIEKSGTLHYKDAKQKAYELFNPFLVSKQDQEHHLKQFGKQEQ